MGNFNERQTFQVSGMQIPGIGAVGVTSDQHPADASATGQGGYKIPPAWWGPIFLIVGFLIVRYLMED